jgi:hypothetical protein
MTDSAQTLVETTVAISATLPTTFDLEGATGYANAGITYALIGQVTDWTPGGKTVTISTSSPIAQRNIDKFKGTENYGADTLTVNRDDDDAGQVIVEAALASDNDYTFRVTFQDATIDYFTGKIVSFSTSGGSADSMVQAVIQLERTRTVVTA